MDELCVVALDEIALEGSRGWLRWSRTHVHVQIGGWLYTASFARVIASWSHVSQHAPCCDVNPHPHDGIHRCCMCDCPTHRCIPATTGVFLSDLWDLIAARLPVAGIHTLGPNIKQILWRYLRTEEAAVEHLEFLLDPVIPPGAREADKPKKLPSGRWRATDMTPTPPLDERIDKVEDAQALGLVIRVKSPLL